MNVSGECHCGKIAYEAKVDPSRSAICNCTDCQIFSGSPWRASVPAAAEHFHLLRGEPRIYIKTAASGAKRAQGFCADCGTPIYATTPDDPKIYNLRLGAVKQRADLPPKKQIWCSSAIAWGRDVRDVPGVPEG